MCSYFLTLGIGVQFSWTFPGTSEKKRTAVLVLPTQTALIIFLLSYPGLYLKLNTYTRTNLLLFLSLYWWQHTSLISLTLSRSTRTPVLVLESVCFQKHLESLTITGTHVFILKTSSPMSNMYLCSDYSYCFTTAHLLNSWHCCHRTQLPGIQKEELPWSSSITGNVTFEHQCSCSLTRTQSFDFLTL